MDLSKFHLVSMKMDDNRDYAKALPGEDYYHISCRVMDKVLGDLCIEDVCDFGNILYASAKDHTYFSDGTFAIYHYLPEDNKTITRKGKTFGRGYFLSKHVFTLLCNFHKTPEVVYDGIMQDGWFGIWVGENAFIDGVFTDVGRYLDKDKYIVHYLDYNTCEEYTYIGSLNNVVGMLRSNHVKLKVMPNLWDFLEYYAMEYGYLL